jgi:hypothetical protein
MRMINDYYPLKVIKQTREREKEYFSKTSLNISTIKNQLKIDFNEFFAFQSINSI